MTTTPVAAPAALLEEMAAAAILAPSSHNTQPWLLRLGDGVIELFADRRRALPVNDPWDRELTISCGAALFNLRVAAAHHGAPVTVDLLPQGVDDDLLARVVPDLARAPEAGLAELQPAIARRHTDRRPFAPHPVVAAHVERLVAAAESEGARLAPLEGDAAGALGGLVADGDRRLFADAEWRHELALWMRPRSVGDGLPCRPGAAAPTRFFLRHHDLGESQAARDERAVRDAPLLAVLLTPGDDPADWLAAGQALQRVLLTGASLGLQASFFNQPIQVPSLRPAVTALAGDGGCAQIALRAGHPRDAVAPAARRPLEDVLI